MDISEKSIEDLIYENLGNGHIHILKERGLDFLWTYDFFARQVNLGKYGILDIVAINYDPFDQTPTIPKTIRICVIEIKKDEINYFTFLQAIRYCKGIEIYLKSIGMIGEFSIALIGTSICKSDFVYMSDFIQNLHCYTIKIDIEKGILFNREMNYSLPDASVEIKKDLHNDIKDMILNKIKNYVTHKQSIINS